MNEYFKQCHIVFFRNLKTGDHDPISGGTEVDTTITALTSGLPAGQSIVNIVPEIKTWPGEVASPDETAQLICPAFERAFSNGFRKVIGVFALPGGLTPALIQEALLSLRPLDFCLGPDGGGGIWLLGMNRYDPSVIHDMPWQGRDLTKKIIRRIGDQKKILYRLPCL